MNIAREDLEAMWNDLPYGEATKQIKYLMTHKKFKAVGTLYKTTEIIKIEDDILAKTRGAAEDIMRQKLFDYAKLHGHERVTTSVQV
jgi:hypothetical protein